MTKTVTKIAAKQADQKRNFTIRFDPVLHACFKGWCGAKGVSVESRLATLMDSDIPAGFRRAVK